MVEKIIKEDVIKIRGNTTKLFNTEKTVRSQDTRLFLGENSSNRNIQTFHAPKYPWILEFAEELRAIGNWSKNEIDLSKEKKDFDSLTPAGKHIFEKGLKFGIALDSCAGRGPLRLFSEGGISNNPEWELYLTNHQNNELLHSESYTEMVRAIYNDVDDFIESIITDDFVLNRADSILKELDGITDILNRREANLVAWDAGWENTVFHRAADGESFINDKLIKKGIYKSAIILNMFEGIRFFATFVTAWSFSEQPEKLLSGSSNIFKLIARDEMMHLDVFQKVIKLLRTNKEEGFLEVVEEMEDEIYELFRTAHKEEMDWIEHLFSMGSPLIGMNEAILKEYMDYIFAVRMTNIGMNPSTIGLTLKTNPLPWINNYLDSSHIKSAPQEIESVNYVAAIDSSLDEDISLEDL
jgi:ribonucleoside-diphosphate reductase beta chain|tara:strand:- start:14759 stop:15991 length:1233 start_codon:yes stop_codon:yes gene_type:complete